MLSFDWLKNICCLTDSYKVSHFKQYPPETSYISSYFESRVGAKFKETVFFGLQYYLKTYLTGQVVTKEKIEKAEKLFNLHFNDRVFNKTGWEYILDKHQGRLPIEIKAVPEGTVVPVSNVLMQVVNTDPVCYWLTNYLETLLVQTWYPCTVATQSREMKKVIMNYLNRSGNPDLIDFRLHDFGFRGVTCPEQAAIGAASHLISFKGTDTFAGILMLNEFYDEEMAGFSIPAAEHSTITSWGQENEIEACRNMLRQYPKGYVAVVSDSFNVFNCCGEIWGKELKDEIIQRDGVLVIRPDSGDPPTVILKILEILGDKFGHSLIKGYKLLNPKITLIQGDGIDFEMIDKILSHIESAGWSSNNVSFGSGGGLLQKLNRDTQKFAFKCSDIIFRNNSRKDVFKDPITDPGKKSKCGRLKLIKKDGIFQTVGVEEAGNDELITVFRNGELLVDHRFEDIRKRAAI